MSISDDINKKLDVLIDLMTSQVKKEKSSSPAKKTVKKKAPTKRKVGRPKKVVEKTEPKTKPKKVKRKEQTDADFDKIPFSEFLVPSRGRKNIKRAPSPDSRPEITKQKVKCVKCGVEEELYTSQIVLSYDSATGEHRYKCNGCIVGR